MVLGEIEGLRKVAQEGAVLSYVRPGARNPANSDVKVPGGAAVVHTDAVLGPTEGVTLTADETGNCSSGDRARPAPLFQSLGSVYVERGNSPWTHPGRRSALLA